MFRLKIAYRFAESDVSLPIARSYLCAPIAELLNIIATCAKSARRLFVLIKHCAVLNLVYTRGSLAHSTWVLCCNELFSRRNL